MTNKKNIYPFVVTLFFVTFHGLASAKCLPDSVSFPECRYQQGDDWCRENGKGNSFAYNDKCLKAQGKNPREQWDACIANVEAQTNKEKTGHERVFSRRLEICGYSPEPTPQELDILEKTVLAFCNQVNSQLPTTGAGYRAYASYNPNGAAIKLLAEKCSEKGHVKQEHDLENKDLPGTISELENRESEKHSVLSRNQESTFANQYQEQSNSNEYDSYNSLHPLFWIILLVAILIFNKRILGFIKFLSVLIPIWFLSTSTSSGFDYYLTSSLLATPLILFYFINFTKKFLTKRRYINYARRFARKKFIQESKIQDIVKFHLATLVRKKMQLIIVDDYGNAEDSKWKNEILYFISRTVKPEILKEETSLVVKDHEISKLVEDLVSKAEGNEEQIVFDPNFSGIDYEHYCAHLLRQYGWDARTTQATGDQGVDLIASKRGHTGAIQCKKYSTPVGNKAVQEVYAGMQYIGAHFCAVVTNAEYTRSARQLSQTLGVFLLHHEELKLLDEKANLD